MELDWLEDFVEVIATRNFSAAAAARNISQPAFSRRIKALETWLGAELVDRSTSPVRLTSTGSLLAPRCQELVDDFYRLRIECQQNANPHNLILSFAALHTIEMFFFPKWLIELRTKLGIVQSHMHGGDFLDCIELLSLGKCDFAIMYNAPEGPPVLNIGPFKSLMVGRDRLIPVTGCDDDGAPIFDVTKAGARAIPFLAYSWKDGYLGKLITLIQRRQKKPIQLETVYQSSLAEGIKRMAIAGMGIAWLPLSGAEGAIRRGQLVQIGGPDLAIDMEVRLYRRAGPMSAEAEAFWTHLKG